MDVIMDKTVDPYIAARRKGGVLMKGNAKIINASFGRFVNVFL